MKLDSWCKRRRLVRIFITKKKRKNYWSSCFPYRDWECSLSYTVYRKEKIEFLIERWGSEQIDRCRWASQVRRRFQSNRKEGQEYRNHSTPTYWYLHIRIRVCEEEKVYDASKSLVNGNEAKAATSSKYGFSTTAKHRSIPKEGFQPKNIYFFPSPGL